MVKPPKKKLRLDRLVFVIALFAVGGAATWYLLK